MIPASTNSATGSHSHHRPSTTPAGETSASLSVGDIVATTEGEAVSLGDVDGELLGDGDEETSIASVVVFVLAGEGLVDTVQVLVPL
jgi:hypothetical protein